MIFVLALSLGLVLGVQAQTRSITNQLVVHLTFDNTMNDNSGRGNNATYNSANGLVTHPAAPTYVTGKIGQAFQFNTTGDASLIEFASLGYPTDLRFGTNTDYSYAFWIYDIANNSDSAFMGCQNWNRSGNVGWAIYAQSGGNFRVASCTGNYTDQIDCCAGSCVFKYVTTMPNVIRDGAWHHLVVTTQRGGNRITYLDGAQIAIEPVPGTGTNTLDADTFLDGLGNPYAVNIGQDGTGAYTQGANYSPPPADGSGGAAISANIDDVGIWRRVMTPSEVTAMYNFGLQGTNLFNVPDVHTPLLLSFTPANGASAVAASIPVTARIQDQDTKVNTNSLLLLVDGVSVPFTLVQNAATNTLTYTQPFLAAPSSVHTNKLIFADNGTPVPSRFTNVSVYTVIVWSNIYLPPPIYLETFDEVVPSTNPPANYPIDIAGNCPAGWTLTNCTSLFGSWGLTPVTSDLYANFAIVPVEIVRTFNFGTRIDMVGTPLMVNGVWITSSLASNNVVFAASDGRANGPQLDVMFTRDYDLTGKSNIWVGYNNILTTERGMFSGLEYSINQGATWLPVAYYMCNNSQCIVLTNNVFDPVATITNTVWPTVRVQPNPCSATPDVSCYTNFLGVDPSWYANLGPYIHLGGRGDNASYHRVEKYPLPQADGQATVRFRFAFSGRDYWDWGFDNFGLYSLASAEPPRITSITKSGANITITWNGTGANAASGLQKTTSLSPPVWSDVPGTIGLSSYSEPTSGAAAYYRVVRY